MRIIPLEPITMDLPDGAKPPMASTADIMISACRVVEPGQGMDVGQQRQAFRVIDAIEAAKKANAHQVILEEPEYGYLLHKMTSTRWLVVDRSIIQAVEAVEKAAKVDPNAPPAEAPAAEAPAPA